jgi:small neutral amino acid transporter SnatA (MarC family)
MTAELFSAVLSAAMPVTTVVLVGAHRLQEVLGERAIVALERLMGLVLTALAVEMLLAGVRTFFASLAR